LPSFTAATAPPPSTRNTASVEITFAYVNLLRIVFASNSSGRVGSLSTGWRHRF